MEWSTCENFIPIRSAHGAPKRLACRNQGSRPKITSMIAWLKSLFAQRFETPVTSIASGVVVSAPELRPAANRRIVRVWVQEGCLVCGACEITCPKVFRVTRDTSIVLEGAPDHFEVLRDAIEEAQFGCCVEVIKIAYE
jgi:ferredoxin